MKGSRNLVVQKRRTKWGLASWYAGITYPT